MPRRGFTVALIGADGAGKTTVARALEHSSSVPVKYIYMGVNWEASNHLLPTTRLMRGIRRRRGYPADAGGRPARATAPPRPRPLPRRVLRAAWRAMSLANRLAEEWYRQLLAWSYVRRGFVVLFDRHFFVDYHAHDVVGRGDRTFARRLHGLMLARAYPKPDLVVFLDAPPTLLHQRKREGTPESLARRRDDYLDLRRHVANFVVVDASEPANVVVSSVKEAIDEYARLRPTRGAAR